MAKAERKMQNPQVRIASSLGGLFLGITAIIAIFANQDIEILVPIAFAFAILGVFLGYFARERK